MTEVQNGCQLKAAEDTGEAASPEVPIVQSMPGPPPSPLQGSTWCMTHT